jgi:hypothetical protein
MTGPMMNYQRFDNRASGVGAFASGQYGREWRWCAWYLIDADHPKRILNAIRDDTPHAQ